MKYRNPYREQLEEQDEFILSLIQRVPRQVIEEELQKISPPQQHNEQ